MLKQYDKNTDKNFDDLAHRFQDNIYKSIKGRVRLAIIERDLRPHLKPGQKIIDAGGGQGQFSIALAKNGHPLTLCDISSAMLDLAKKAADEQGVDDARFLHCGLQQLPDNIDNPADILLCHAVLEWMAEPAMALGFINQCLKPGGVLSLAFFNIHSIIFKNLVRGNYRKVQSNNFVGTEGSLTPINPLDPEDVFRWCNEYGFDIIQTSGIRVFHDYIATRELRERSPDDTLALELEYSQKEPYRSMGRYLHIVAKKIR